MPFAILLFIGLAWLGLNSFNYIISIRIVYNAICCQGFLHMFVGTLVVYSADFFSTLLFLFLLKLISIVCLFVSSLTGQNPIAWQTCHDFVGMPLHWEYNIHFKQIQITSTCIFYACERCRHMTNACQWSTELMRWAQVIWFVWNSHKNNNALD